MASSAVWRLAAANTNACAGWAREPEDIRTAPMAAKAATKFPAMAAIEGPLVDHPEAAPTPSTRVLRTDMIAGTYRTAVQVERQSFSNGQAGPPVTREVSGWP